MAFCLQMPEEAIPSKINPLAEKKVGKYSLPRWLVLSLKIAATLIILAVIFWKMNLSSFYTEISTLKFLPLFLAVLITFPAMYLRAWRWKEAIRTVKADFPLRNLLQFTYISLTLGLVTPGRLGEFIKVHHLSKKSGIETKKSLYTVLLDKLMDISTVLVFSTLGAYFLFGQKNWLLLLFIILFLFSLFFYMPYNLFLRFSSYLPLLKRYFSSLRDYNLPFSSSLRLSLLSYLIWLSLALQGFIILWMMGTETLSFWAVLGVVSLMSFSSFIPITIGGLGLREALAAFLLLSFGIAAEKAVLFSLLYTAVSYAPIVAFGIYYIIKFK